MNALSLAFTTYIIRHKWRHIRMYFNYYFEIWNREREREREREKYGTEREFFISLNKFFDIKNKTSFFFYIKMIFRCKQSNS